MLRRGIEQAIQCRIRMSQYGFAVCLEILIDEDEKASPQRGSSTGSANLHPSSGGATCIGHCTINTVTIIGITSCRHIRDLTVPTPILIDAQTTLPVGLHKGVADTAPAPHSLWSALRLCRV